MDRRNFLKGGLIAGAAVSTSLALPAKLAAMPRKGSPRDRALFEIAQRELNRLGGAIWRHDIVGISDFGLHSALPRFHIVNLEREEVQTLHVSHGRGSDPEHDGWLTRYSNVVGSNATSRGAYVTYEWYQGKHGTSVRLGGLDPTNDAALRRYIVMHQADYAEPRHIDAWGRLGRSQGCFAYGTEEYRAVLTYLSGGRLIYADSLGLQDDGHVAVGPPSSDLELLRPDRPTLAQRYRPGSF